MPPSLFAGQPDRRYDVDLRDPTVDAFIDEIFKDKRGNQGEDRPAIKF